MFKSMVGVGGCMSMKEGKGIILGLLECSQGIRLF